MSEVWITKSLQEITTKIGSGATPRGGKKAYKTEGISLIRSLNVHDRSFRTKDLAFIDDKQADQLNNVVIEVGDVLLNITGASIARCCLVPSEFLPARVNQHVSIVRANQKQILPKFLCYILTSKDYKDQLLDTGEKQGATRQALTKSLIQNFRVTYPESLSEQKRIVAILDEAFGAIARAKENAERNLANARELFDSYLNRVFTEKGEGWEETTVGDQLTLQRGFDITKKQQKPGEVPVVSSGGIKSYHDTAKIEGPCVLLGRKGSVGNIFFLESDCWPHDTTLWVKDFKGNSELLVYYMFRGLDLKNLDSGAANPALNRNNVHPIKIYWPNADVKQNFIATRLQELEKHISTAENIYRKKISALDELNQSILQKAFTGQLTSKSKELELVP